MPRNLYQYETSPRKYETEYNPKRKTTTTKKGLSRKEIERRKFEKEKLKRAEEKKKKTKQLIAVIFVFGMLLAVSYREISIMEMFNQKKNLENQLALIEKENGQIEKSIKEQEGTLEWNSIKQRATEELGMQVKTKIPLELDKTDNVETNNKFIKEEKTSLIEKILKFIIK